MGQPCKIIFFSGVWGAVILNLKLPFIIIDGLEVESKDTLKNRKINQQIARLKRIGFFQSLSNNFQCFLSQSMHGLRVIEYLSFSNKAGLQIFIGIGS